VALATAAQTRAAKTQSPRAKDAEMTSAAATADPELALLRFTVASVAYRGAKALRGVPDNFAEFEAGPKTRTPGQILAHLGDLFDWALTQAEGRTKWHDSPAIGWQAGSERFFAALEKFDRYLASGAPISGPLTRLFGGAIADAHCHIGQINVLRGIAGCPVRPENYSRAEIVAGRVGSDQAPPEMEF
jgi:hypothetical protein